MEPYNDKIKTEAQNNDGREQSFVGGGDISKLEPSEQAWNEVNNLETDTSIETNPHSDYGGQRTESRKNRECTIRRIF